MKNAILFLLRHASIVGTLLRRDLVVRYGRDNIGFAWVVVEAMILATGVMTLWAIAKPTYEHGVAVLAFVLSGYMPLTMFRHVTNANIHLMRGSASLLYHRSVTIWHAYISRSLMEFIGSTMALIVIYLIMLAFGQVGVFEDIRLIISGWLMLALFAFAVGAFIAGMTELSEPSERFIQSFQYLIVPMSGCFFMMDWMPTQAQDIISYVPMIHAFEMFRDGMFGSTVPTHYSPPYMLSVTVVILAVGLFMMHKARQNLQIG